jgi:uncharacterized protein YkwD
VTAARTRLRVEPLGWRDCPTTASLFNGVLTVTGTTGNDQIQVTEANGVISAAGQSFNSAQVGLVVITALEGDDTIRDDSAKASVIYGGTGNDWIYSGRGDDVVYGGQGDDTLFGGPGNDRLVGGAGTDALTDNGGVNVLRQGSPAMFAGNSAIESDIITLVNNFRVANGVAPLTVNPRLNVAAQIHTIDMTAISNVYGPQTALQHTLEGTTRPQVSDRLDAVGYDQWTTAFAYGENIAFGYDGAQSVVNGWINSPGHRANILNPNFVETGASVMAAADGTLFFTQEFGKLA